MSSQPTPIFKAGEGSSSLFDKQESKPQYEPINFSFREVDNGFIVWTGNTELVCKKKSEVAKLFKEAFAEYDLKNKKESE